MQNSLIYNKIFEQSAWLISGILYGLGYILLPHLWLFWLVWFAFVPILLQLKNLSFKRWFLSIFLMNSVALSISLIPLFKTTWLLYVATAFSQAIFLMTPWLILWWFRQISWGMFVLPFLWISNEWLLTFFPLSIPTILGVTQIENTPFIQYYDLTGVFGGSFWVVLLNVLLANLILKGFQYRKLLYIILSMFLPPLFYGIWIFHLSETHLPTTKVGIIQTGLKPTRDLKYLYNLIFLSDKLLQNNQQVDLIIFPETAVGWDFWGKDYAQERQLLFDWISNTRIPVIFGAFEHKVKMFNIAMLITPEFADYALNQPLETVLPIKIYKKQHLFPFIEQVPFSDYFPWLSDLLIKENDVISINLSSGDHFTVFSFSNHQQNVSQIGTLLCYEALFPEISAHLTKIGAQSLAILTNDDSETLTEFSYYLLASHARVRAIETRRDIARVSTTGFSLVTNRFGEIEKISQPFQEDIFAHNLTLSNELSFYVKYPYLFPLFCVVVSFIGLMSLLKCPIRKTTSY
ncbi:MAG: hypothetical protein RIT27_1195 [Pseudomonadota bacterium]